MREKKKKKKKSQKLSPLYKMVENLSSVRSLFYNICSLIKDTAKIGPKVVPRSR